VVAVRVDRRREAPLDQEVEPMDAPPSRGIAARSCDWQAVDDESMLVRLRGLVGHEVRLDTAGGTLVGTLVSCTTRSAWVVAGDVDHVVALPHLFDVGTP
jgi:hypothetical protein